MNFRSSLRLTNIIPFAVLVILLVIFINSRFSKDTVNKNAPQAQFGNRMLFGGLGGPSGGGGGPVQAAGPAPNNAFNQIFQQDRAILPPSQERAFIIHGGNFDGMEFDDLDDALAHYTDDTDSVYRDLKNQIQLATDAYDYDLASKIEKHEQLSLLVLYKLSEPFDLEKLEEKNQSGFNFGLITEYGCWCRANQYHGLSAGKGVPKDNIDKACHDRQKAVSCACAEKAPQNPEFTKCKPYTTYDFKAERDSNGEHQITCKNAEESCERELCEIDKLFAVNIKKAMIHEGWSEKYSMMYGEPFDRSGLCIPPPTADEIAAAELVKAEAAAAAAAAAAKEKAEELAIAEAAAAALAAEQARLEEEAEKAAEKARQEADALAEAAKKEEEAHLQALAAAAALQAQQAEQALAEIQQAEAEAAAEQERKEQADAEAALAAALAAKENATLQDVANAAAAAAAAQAEAEKQAAIKAEKEKNAAEAAAAFEQAQKDKEEAFAAEAVAAAAVALAAEQAAEQAAAATAKEEAHAAAVQKEKEALEQALAAQKAEQEAAAAAIVAEQAEQAAAAAAKEEAEKQKAEEEAAAAAAQKAEELKEIQEAVAAAEAAVAAAALEKEKAEQAAIEAEEEKKRKEAEEEAAKEAQAQAELAAQLAKEEQEKADQALAAAQAAAAAALAIKEEAEKEAEQIQAEAEAEAAAVAAANAAAALAAQQQAATTEPVPSIPVAPEVQEDQDLENAVFQNGKWQKLGSDETSLGTGQINPYSDGFVQNEGQPINTNTGPEGGLLRSMIQGTSWFGRIEPLQEAVKITPVPDSIYSVKTETTQFSKTCCGLFPKRYPFFKGSNLQCCSTGTYNPSKQTCCTDLSVLHGVNVSC